MFQKSDPIPAEVPIFLGFRWGLETVGSWDEVQIKKDKEYHLHRYADREGKGMKQEGPQKACHIEIQGGVHLLSRVSVLEKKHALDIASTCYE